MGEFIKSGSAMTNWINELLGVNMTPTVSFILLFAAIIVGVLLLIWIARKLLGGTFVSGGRGRHLRLAVMDATPVDSRRRLVLVRRDDVEHLILIGGPTDVVVEQNIRIAGPRETRSIQTAAEPAAPARPVEMARPAQPPRAEPERQAPPPAAPVAPLQHRPPPAPQAPAAPYLPPRPAAPPAPMAARPAPATPAPAVVMPPRPVAQSAPRVEPAAASMASRPDPVMSAPVTAQAAPPVFSRPVEPQRTSDQEMDDSLLADLTESLSFDDDEIAPDVSLEKEMESLLSTLDTQKDRIS